MGLPEFPVVGTYKAYKKRTKRIEDYLLETGKKIGFQSKRAKATYSQVADIRATEYVEFAEAIKAHPGFKLPEWLVPEVEETVNLRRRVARFYESVTAKKGPAAADNAAADQAHNYFIEVLERVLAVFTPKARVPKRKKRPQAQALKEISANEVANRFGILDIEVTKCSPDETNYTAKVQVVADKDLGCPVNLPSATSSSLNDEEELAEAQFAALCLFEDVKEIRMFLGTLWEEYKCNTADSTALMTVAMVTNIAIDIVRRLDEDFRKSFTRCNSYKQILSDAVASMVITEHGETLVAQNMDSYAALEYTSKAANTHLEMDEGDWLMFCTYSAIEGFMPINGEVSLPLQGLLQPLFKLSDELTTAMDERRAEDTRILWGALPEIHFAAIINILQEKKIEDPDPIWQFYYSDEISKGMADRIENGVTQLWFVFAVRMYVDIYKIMGESLSAPFDELRNAGLDATVVLATCLREEKERAAARGESYDDPAGIGLSLYIIKGWTGHDIVLDVLEPLLMKKGLTKEVVKQAREPFFLHKRHPLMCGTARFILARALRNVAIRVLVPNHSTVFSTMFLYNGLLQSGNVKVWDEMEAYIKLHENSGIFPGKRPQTRNACLNVFKAATERQRANFGFEFKGVTPVSDFLACHYALPTEPEWGVDKLENLVKSMLPGASKRFVSQMATDGVSAIKVLQALKDILFTCEIPKLFFDYLSLDRKCRRMLLAAWKELLPLVNAVCADHNIASAKIYLPWFNVEGQVNNIIEFALSALMITQKRPRTIVVFQGPRSHDPALLQISRMAIAVLSRKLEEGKEPHGVQS